MDDKIPQIQHITNVSSQEESFSVCSRGGCFKLEVYDWMKDIPRIHPIPDIVEVRFKHTRKGYYRNVNQLRLSPGDIIAVEASPGHDIGIVTLTGDLVMKQLKKNNIGLNDEEIRKIYRKAKDTDIQKWKEAIAQEKELLVKSRKIAERLKLNMKIGDVEMQGDKTKAIFYYIADERVDFREMIKIMAEEMKIRVEMRQIGARQEAGRIGGTGPCGRELCCTTWISNFCSVSTSAAKYQDVSLNPQKLAGQCSKLKCCLNYELPTYLDAQKDFPSPSIVLETDKGPLYHKKNDILKRIMWYSPSETKMEDMLPLSVHTVKDIIALNKQGKKASNIKTETVEAAAPVIDFHDVLDQSSLSRFDDKQKKSSKRHRGRHDRHHKHHTKAQDAHKLQQQNRRDTQDQQANERHQNRNTHHQQPQKTKKSDK